MTRKTTTPSKGNGDPRRLAEEETYKVEDRRHWAAEPTDGDDAEDSAEVAPASPSIIDEYRGRAEAAEQKLQEYIEAFKGFKREQEEFRERMGRDVERRVGLQFGSLVGELLESVDNLDLALEHVGEVPAAEPLARGVTMARDRFLAALENHGVERLDPGGAAFDPNQAEAVRVDTVTERERGGRVTETLQPGYRLGELVIRPARVAVGRYVESDDDGG